MPDCKYCGDTFDDEEAELRHLGEEHGNELGAIDQRRVDGLDSSEFDWTPADEGDGGVAAGPLVLGLVLLAAVLVVVYVVVFVGGGGGSPATGAAAGGDAGEASLATVAQTPGAAGSAHEHGTVEVVIDGQRIDFSRQEYQLRADRFHFEGGEGRVWHKHATGVTLEWAMATLDIGVSEDTVVFEGTVYRDSDPGTSVTVEVDGQPVDPQTYVLDGVDAANADQGDSVRVVVETDDGG